jgi:hypothetical protein
MKEITIQMKYTGKIPVGVPALGRALSSHPIEPGEIVEVPEPLALGLKHDRNWKVQKAVQPKKKPELKPGEKKESEL